MFIFRFFQRRILQGRRKLERKQSYETQSLEKTFVSGEQYLRRWEEVFKRGDIEELEDFGSQLEQFMARTNSRWMGAKFLQLKPKHREMLHNLFAELNTLYDDVYDYVRELERDETLRHEIDSLALPETTEVERDRVTEAWRKKPFSHSPRLIVAAQGMPTPQ